MACERVIDGCLQLHGGEGVCQDQPLARAFAGARSLRLADGPDEVHEVVIARFELKAAELRRRKRAKKAKPLSRL
jgi:acyl-CoA dehydrogenase